MTNISNILNPVRILKSRDPITEASIPFKDAKKQVKNLLIEGVKIGVGIGGFIAVARLMARQNSLLSSLGVGAVAIGGSLLLTSRVSVILYDATKVTAGLVLFKTGCIDLLVSPAVASVKGISLSSFPSLGKGLLSLGTGYLRLIGGGVAFVQSVKLMTSGKLKVHIVKNADDDDDIRVYKEKSQEHLIDRGIIQAVDGAADFITRKLGYADPATRRFESTESEYPFEEAPPLSASPNQDSPASGYESE